MTGFQRSHASPAHRMGQAGSRAAKVSCVLFLLALCGVAPARAIQIQVIYDPTDASAVDPCASTIGGGGQTVYLYKACAGGNDRTPALDLLMSAAAAYWADVFESNETVTIRYWWYDDGDPDANVDQTDMNRRPSQSHIRIPVDRDYYYDPTPDENSEFDMGPRLYRTTHPDEQAEAFSGTPPEVFEVSYTGEEKQQRFADLLTIVMHEMAHALGMDQDITTTGTSPECSAPPDDYFEVNPFWVGGAIMALKAYENGTDWDCAHLALGGITACNGLPDEVLCKSHQAILWPGFFPDHRSLPGAADIIAVSEASDWFIVDLPRKYSLQSGDWNLSNNWLGDRVPDAGDLVFIVNQQAVTTITLFGPATARGVTVTDGNQLQVFSPLLVGERISIEGTGTTLLADIGSDVQAMDLDVDAGGLLDVPFGGAVDAFRLSNLGEIKGAGSIDVVSLTNAGRIRANGGPLTFTTSNFNPAFDLDGGGAGSMAGVQIEAVTGDLTFDGDLVDSLRATMRVGAGETLAFTHGWVQEYSAGDTLSLEGTGVEARIQGNSTFYGPVDAQGLSRISGSAVFQPQARLFVTIGGLVAGTQHSRMNVEGALALGGTLIIQLAQGYLPSPGDEFVIMTSPGVSGQFDDVQGADVGINGISFDVVINPFEVRLIVKAPAGAVPDGNLVAGPPLEVEPVIGGDLSLTWGAATACTGERDFEVYEGTLGDFTSHVPMMCTTGGATTLSFTPSPGDKYYLIVPHNGDREGSYGRDSSGAERPQGAASCLRQAVAVCGPS